MPGRPPMTCVTCGHQALHDMAGIGVCRATGCGCDGPCDPQPAPPKASGRPSWLDRAVDEALTVCPTVAPWEIRLALIAAAPTIQNAAAEQPPTGDARDVIRTWLKRHDYPSDPAWQIRNLLCDLRAAYPEPDDRRCCDGRPYQASCADCPAGDPR